MSLVINPIISKGGLTPTIVVTAPTGSTVTCNGVAGVEVGGTWTFKNLKFGEYTIAKTRIGAISKTITVDKIALYKVDLRVGVDVCITSANFEFTSPKLSAYSNTVVDSIDYPSLSMRPTVLTHAVIDGELTYISAGNNFGYTIAEKNKVTMIAGQPPNPQIEIQRVYLYSDSLYSDMVKLDYCVYHIAGASYSNSISIYPFGEDNYVHMGDRLNITRAEYSVSGVIKNKYAWIPRGNSVTLIFYGGIILSHNGVEKINSTTPNAETSYTFEMNSDTKIDNVGYIPSTEIAIVTITN